MNITDDILPTDALQVASLWFVQLTSGDFSDSDRVAWQTWRQQDPANEYAWQQVEKVTRKFSVPGISPAVSLATLEHPASPARRRALRQLAVVFALGGMSWAGYRHTPWQDWTADYKTVAGEQRQIKLQDGSRLTLNTKSAIDVIFTGQERRIVLHKGEVLIETAAEKDQRQFIATTAHGDITALGTVFAIRCEEKNSRVDLFEGAVKIRAAAHHTRTQRLNAGETIRFNTDHIEMPVKLAYNQPNWLNGILLADDMPLNNFIEDVARYRQGHLLGDDSLDNLRISGAFPIADTDGILDSLTTTLPVKIQRFTNYWVKVKQVEKQIS